jgi:hypothetical protein
MPSGMATLTASASSSVTGFVLSYTITGNVFTPPNVPLCSELYGLTVSSGYINVSGSAVSASIVLPDSGSGYCIINNNLFVNAAPPSLGVYRVTPSYASLTTPISAYIIASPGASSVSMTLSGGSVASSGTSPGSGIYLFTFTPTIGMSDGVVTGIVTATDAYNNPVTAYLTLPLLVDRVAPTTPVSATPVSIYSTNGTLSYYLHSTASTGSGLYGHNISLLKDGAPCVSGITAAASAGDTLISFSNLASGSYTLEYNTQDNAGNTSSLSNTGTTCYVYLIPTTGTLTTASATGINKSITVSGTFSVPVTAFNSSGVLLKNAIVSHTAASSTGSIFIVTPNQPGYVSIKLDNSAFTSIVADAVTAPMPLSATNQLDFYYDPIRPEAILASDLQCTCTNPFPINVHFSKPVTNVTTSGFTAVSGAITSVSGSGFNYIVYVQPTSGVTPVTGGPYTITTTVNASAGTDYVGNYSIASTPISVIYDDRIPTVVSLHGEIN